MYMDVITTMQVIGLQSYCLKKVVSKLKEKWKRDIKTRTDDLNSESQKKKKWNSKQLKGTCRSCGKIGHKSPEAG